MLAIPPRVRSSIDVEPTASTALVSEPASLGSPCFALFARSPLAAAFSTANEVDEPVSDAPCRARPTVTSLTAGAPNTCQDRLPPPSRRRRWLPRPEAPSIDECSREGARHSPPASPPFAMSFRPAFTSTRSRVSRLDRSRARGCSPRDASTATCRSPTSAIETTREHDRRTVRALPTLREVALSPSYDGRWRRDLRPALSRVAEGLANRAFHGPGAEARLAPRWFGSSGGDRSRSEALPQPDRLGHPMSLARRAAGWWCRLRVGACAPSFLRARRRTPWRPRVSVPGPPHAFPREGERDPLHPARM